MDVDIKNKLKDVQTTHTRELFIEDLERASKTVLMMYGAKNIEFEIVAKDMTRSFHLYSNVVVKLEDCR